MIEKGHLQRNNFNNTSIKSIKFHLIRTEKKGNSNNHLIRSIELHFIQIHYKLISNLNYTAKRTPVNKIIY